MQAYQAPLQSVVLGGGAEGVDDQVARLVVEGELAEILDKERLGEETRDDVQDTDHAAGEVVVLPGGVDNGAVRIQPD